MKVVLVRYHDKGNINSRLPKSLNQVQGVLPPLGIAYIAAVLKKSGHEVKIIDALVLNLGADEFRRAIADESADIVGITAMISNAKGALEAAQIAKEPAGAIEHETYSVTATDMRTYEIIYESINKSFSSTSSQKYPVRYPDLC